MKSAAIILCISFFFGLLCGPVPGRNDNDDDDDNDGRNRKRVITTKPSTKGPAFRRSFPRASRFGRNSVGDEKFSHVPAEERVDAGDWEKASLLGPNPREVRKLQLEAQRRKEDEFWTNRLKGTEFSPNAPYALGHTYLHFAAWQGYPDLTTYLLSIGANPKFKTPQGLSSFDLAERRGHGHILKLLKPEPESPPKPAKP